MRVVRSFSAAMGLIALVSGCATNRMAYEKAEPGLIALTTTIGDESLPAALYVPPGYDPKKPWPLVLFLHGMGERGTDGEKQTKVGIGPAIEANPGRFPCLVLMPQCSPKRIWGVPESMAHIGQAMAQVLDRYNVDPDRIALTGLSMGGHGAYVYGAKNIDRFSCIMPVCGPGVPAEAKVLATLPMRIFHGADDKVVPASRSHDMVAAIKAAGGDILYTEYSNTGHNSWDQAYGDADAIAWLLAARRP